MPKKLLIAVTAAIAMLVAAASAYAALNTYTAKFSFTSKKAGTAAKPAPLGFTQDLTAKGQPGKRTAVLLNLKTTIYGVKATTKGLPTCSIAQISAAGKDTVCPKGAEVASGYINAVVGSATNFTPSDPTAFNCDPALDVWNSGGGKLTFFFVDTAAHKCGVLKTGSVGPYSGTIKQSGKNLVVNVPIPKSVDFPLPGLVGSLEKEHLVWVKSSKNTKGKTQTVLASVGCKNGKRPYSEAFTATSSTTGSGGTKETKTVSGSAACTK